VDEGELAEAKAYLTGSFPLTVETPDEIATQVLNVWTRANSPRRRPTSPAASR